MLMHWFIISINNDSNIIIQNTCTNFLLQRLTFYTFYPNYNKLKTPLRTQKLGLLI
jgi:hypothetical protein